MSQRAEDDRDHEVPDRPSLGAVLDPWRGITVTDERPRARRERVREAPLVLRVVHPAGLARRLVVPADDRALLGRDPEAGALAILHPTVSRRHADVSWDRASASLSVLDLASRNGTWLGGQRIPSGGQATARGGDVLRLGAALLVIEPESDAGIDEVDADRVSYEAVPGDSFAARRLRAAIVRAADDRSPVLVTGETGTGKELIAVELHRLSGRAGELITLNCAAVGAQVFESQLFGHERGSFTGATGTSPGLFRAADGGTLFLDEIGDLPAELQAKLLRAVQTGEVLPVGAGRPERVDVRIIAATNRRLEDLVERGQFRRDLFARLALRRIDVPSLAERRGDVLGWVARLHRIWRAGRASRVDELELSADAAQRVLLAEWPENLRGLDRLVHELGDPGGRGPIAGADLPPWVRGGVAAPSAAPAPAAPTRAELLAALEEHGWSIRATARQLGRDRRQIYRWIDGLKIARPVSE